MVEIKPFNITEENVLDIPVELEKTPVVNEEETKELESLFSFNEKKRRGKSKKYNRSIT